MKTLLLAVAAALSLGVGSANADGGGQGPTLFTMIEAQLAAKAQGKTPVPTTPHSGAATFVYSAPQNQGTWLFAPQDDGGANN